RLPVGVVVDSDDVLVLETLDLPPGLPEGGIQRVADQVEGNRRSTAARGIGNHVPNGSAKRGRYHRIEARPFFRTRAQDGALIRPVFGDEHGLRLMISQRVRQILQKSPASVAVDDCDLVEAEA